MAAKKQKTNLFSGGLLANATSEASLEQHEGSQAVSGKHLPGQQIAGGEEDDPLFGNAKRILDLTQKAVSITDVSAFPHIALEKLDDNPYQPRRRMSQKRLDTLAHEIQAYGFKGVLLARVHPGDSQRYQLVYGHRRREAAKLAGLKEVPVMIDNTINDDEMKFLAVNENVLRDDLTPVDEAYAYTSMLEEMSQDAVAARLGVSRGYIRNRIDILKAPGDVQDMVEEKPDTMKAVAYLKDVQEDDIRKTVIQALMNEEITINQLKAFIENLRKAKSAPEISLVREEARVSLLQGQNGQHSQLPQDPVQKEAPSSKVAHSVLTQKGVIEKPKASLVQQSKEQTDAITDTTRVETFTKYLQKYAQRLHDRPVTPDETAALHLLVSVVKDILESHL